MRTRMGVEEAFCLERLLVIRSKLPGLFGSSCGALVPRLDHESAVWYPRFPWRAWPSVMPITYNLGSLVLTPSTTSTLIVM